MRLQNTVRKRIKYAQFCRHLRRIALGAKRKGAGAPRTPRQERGAFLKYTWEERRAFLKYRRRFQMGSERKRQCVLRGSLTVEAALLMPVIFLVVFMSLYLTVHIHNRMWICAYAAEQAVSGHIQPDPELLFAGKMVSERSESDTQRSVCIRGETVYFTGQVLWGAEVSACYDICRPVPYLWKIKAAKGLVD